jgi:hypothetical protein
LSFPFAHLELKAKANVIELNELGERDAVGMLKFNQKGQ